MYFLNLNCKVNPPNPSKVNISFGYNSISAKLAKRIKCQAYYLGLDFGTSGARTTVINDSGDSILNCKVAYTDGPSSSTSWKKALIELIQSVPADVRASLRALAIDATSATTLLVNGSNGDVLAPPKMYHEAQSKDAVAATKGLCPVGHTASSATSTLAKVVAWHLEGALEPGSQQVGQPCIMHQADWLAWQLHGLPGTTDWNNALKLGYDPGLQAYPDWLANTEFFHCLPQRVLPPGVPMGPVSPSAAASLGLPPTCSVVAGTTDSNAAFIAALGAEAFVTGSQAGLAVTSLGSTLAVKLISDVRVDAAQYGVYSHRLGDTWLVGGASNTGGAVLRSLGFSDQQLRDLSAQMDPEHPTGLDYYPLVGPGERFPVNDPDLQPRLTPRPESDVQFLQGVFEGMARIEAAAYAALRDGGASPLVKVITAGGGAQNPVWTRIRERALGVPVVAAENGEACYGAALLALQGCKAKL